jgi:hypothetical protein
VATPVVPLISQIRALKQFQKYLGDHALGEVDFFRVYLFQVDLEQEEKSRTKLYLKTFHLIFMVLCGN